MPPNPLVELRLARGEGWVDFARFLGTSKTTVQFAEKGCYLSIPQVYRKFLSPQDFAAYQGFRRAKRLSNFTPADFPPGIHSIERLLQHLGLKPYTFAERICVQPAEVFRILTQGRSRRRYIPENLVQAFVTIGVSPEWIASLETQTD